jgi:ABC-2 type transport system ATP-binding protein
VPGDAVIETVDLTKRFGSLKAVDGVSLRVPAGIAFGFLGPNGAGKTTLIRMLLGLARPTSGGATVRGYPVPDETRSALERVGGIVEEPRFYGYMTGQQNLEAWAPLLGAGARARIAEALERVGLAERANKKVSTYSQGMRQRLGVARALLNDPELLVLDEPTNGLDPAGMAEFRTTVRDLVEREGRTVFISSHLLDEIEKMCDHVAIVNHGRVVVQGSVRSLIEGGKRGLVIDVDDVESAARVIVGFDGSALIERRPDGKVFVATDPGREAAMALTRALVQAGVGVASLTASEESLEQRYLEITGGETSERDGKPG